MTLGLKLAGWVANAVDPTMARQAENVATLRQRIAAPLLGEIPYLAPPTAESIAAHLDIQPLL